MTNKRPKGLGIYLAIMLALVLIATFLFSLKPSVTKYKYSEIIGYFQRGEVTEFTMNVGSGDLEMTVTSSDEKIVYRVPHITLFINNTAPYIEEYNEAHPDAPMVYDFEPAQEVPWWLSFIPSVLLIGVMLVFWWLMLRQQRGGGNVMGFAKVKPRTNAEGRKVTFEDVAGADEEKEELVEVVEFLKNPSKFSSLGAHVPKGVLLMGPPGTGKTLLARAVAGEADVPFFSISGSDFVEMFVGVGASRVRDLFEQAKKNSPSIIFIDEIDAVGRQRGAGLGGGHDEREQTLNQLLVEMDGFSSNSGIIIIAATNRKDILDPALLRPGRFDRQIYVNYPDIKGREAILKVHVKNKPIAPDVDLSVVAKTTPGFTGADLENLVNEAALLAVKRNLKAITMPEFQEALIKVVAGPEKRSAVMSEKEKRLTAFHEAGHAVCTYYLPSQDPVHQISIIPRGAAGGFTMSLPEEDKKYHTRTEMAEGIVTLLGGRVAELLTLDDISTGASNDLERATKVATAMVTRYGFSDKIGPVVYGKDENEVFLGRDIGHTRNYSEQMASAIDIEIRAVIENAYNKSREILENHMQQLQLIAGYLYDNETVGGDEFKLLMETGNIEEAVQLREEHKRAALKARAGAVRRPSNQSAGNKSNDNLTIEIE